MANVSNNLILTTDFSQAPYYDDYDHSKNYYRILFRPGFAVQGRELTQLQTMLQKQIDRFGKHVFRDGSIVLPGNFAIEKNVDYVKINDLDSAGDEVNVENLKGKTLVGQTTGLIAIVIDVLDGTQDVTNTKTLYVRYTNTSPNDNVTKVFATDEILLDSTDGTTAVVLSSSATGKGARFSISEGVLFAKECFIVFPSQSIILERYDTTPDCKLGFIVEESIITSATDDSLLDPAVGSSNYAAPGADRLKLTPYLEKYEIDATESADFIKLFEIREGVIQELYERSQYSILRDELAKRTFDESGDYVVNGLNVRLRENLDNGENFGYSNTGNSQLLSVGVEPGVGYVKGYEVNKLVTTWTTTDKGLTYQNVSGEIVTAVMGSYLLIDETVGAWVADEGTEILLYDTAQNRISSNGWSSASQTGSNIGTARVRGFEYYTGVPGTANAQYKLYVNDIKMLGSNSLTSVKSVYYSSAGTSNWGADIVLNASGQAVLQEVTSAPMIWRIGAPAIRSLRDTSGNPDMAFTFRRTEDISIASNGTFSIATAIPDEEFPYGTVTLTDTETQDIYLTINENKSITLSGSVTSNSGSGTITGSGTNFTNLNVGDAIEINTLAGTYIITAIASTTSMTVTPVAASSVSGQNFSKVYKKGALVDLTGKGATGVQRTATATPNSLVFDLKETLGSSTSATITYKLSKQAGREIAKTLRPYRYVKINTVSHSAGTSGPYSLGFSDMYRIRSIRSNTGPLSAMTEGSDVSGNFTISNGQKDTYYDFASITPKTALSAGTHLLVELDYFVPDFTQGTGYFSVDSYPIDDENVSNTTISTATIPLYKSPTTGAVYDLRNSIDFRSVKVPTANDATTVAAATTNPSETTTFATDGSGLRLPIAGSQIVFDYSHYLPRRDIVVMDKDGNISVIKGVPSSLPITPVVPDNTMLLAKLSIAPYPSIASNYANQINRVDLASIPKSAYNIRFTMRDIGVLKSRIENIEYYTALNALEKNAVDMKILDEDGLDRFKNGIFVDNFTNHSLGATYSVDYNIVVDPNENTIRPMYDMNSIRFNPVTYSGVTLHGDLATLPYTEKQFNSQPKATSYRNVELTSYRFPGSLYVAPEVDVWVDTEKLPDLHINQSSGNPVSGGSKTTTSWNAWQDTVTGYRVVDQETGRILASAVDYGAETYVAAINPATGEPYGWSNSARYEMAMFSHDYHMNTGDTTITIEKFGGSQRTGTTTTATTKSKTTSTTQNLGEKVISTSIIPYIRPQILNIFVRGMKRNTRIYCFFDTENMSNYVIPYTPNSSTRSEIISYMNSSTGKLNPFDTGYLDLGVTFANRGSSITTDSNGEAFFMLQLPPEKPFRVGQREIKVTDSPTNSDVDATTSARNYFVAQGLTQYKQKTILTTRTTVNQTSYETSSISENSNYTEVIVDHPSCMAYSFLVKAPTGEEGLFMTGFDIYFFAKSSTLGVWFELREMNSAGGITRTQVPFSEVWLTPSQVTTTADASTPTRVNFKMPIFLYNDTQYALVMHTEGINPDYYVWISRLGEKSVSTGETVTSRPLTGTLYTTNNNLNWDIVPEADLKVNMYRAAFTTGSTGTINLGNKPIDKLFITNETAAFTNYGEPIIGDDIITLTGITGGTIAANNYLIGNTTATNTSVVSINSNLYTMANTGYVVGEKVTEYHSANMVATGVTANISVVKTGTATLGKYNTEGDENYIEHLGSNGNFFVGSTIRGKYSGTRATITSIGDYRYSVFDFEATYLNFNKTSTQFEIQTTANSSGVVDNYKRINENENYYYDSERVVFGRNNEVSTLSSDPSVKVRTSLSSTSEYLSPVVDITKSQMIIVNNIINNDTTGETGKNGGNILNKYISKVITLAEDQDAEDIMVRLTAYRPPSTDIKVYMKFLNAEDSETLNEKNWIELQSYKNGTVYSSLSNSDDFIEYRFNIPSSYMTGGNGEFQYTNGAGATFTGFKHFTVKIGLIGTNSAIVPRVGDLQCIALQI